MHGKGRHIQERLAYYILDFSFIHLLIIVPILLGQ